MPIPKYRLQIRPPHKRYLTVHTYSDLSAAGWGFRQYLGPTTPDYSVRVVDARGKVVARATPKREQP